MPLTKHRYQLLKISFPISPQDLESNIDQINNPD